MIIECSPFLRTLMTAAHIAKGLGHAKVRVNYLFCELLAPHIFEECPLDQIAMKVKKKEHIVKTYLDNVDFEVSDHYVEQAQKLYPENKHKGIDRTKEMIKHFSEKYKTSDKKVAHLAVTHGFFVNKFALNLNGINPYSEYCSISGATLSNGKASLILDSYADHVQTW